ncbi:hypothetical protein HMPREF9012_2114 [Bacteroidetes bacterium oral taxon 272 str. F0290]|nr:hypothetical protein HMPREF9012_2114 [Bacteroidetes bacterium oral taxon 272 str. F0290]
MKRRTVSGKSIENKKSIHKTKRYQETVSLLRGIVLCLSAAPVSIDGVFLKNGYL